MFIIAAIAAVSGVLHPNTLIAQSHEAQKASKLKVISDSLSLKTVLQPSESAGSDLFAKNTSTTSLQAAPQTPPNKTSDDEKDSIQDIYLQMQEDFLMSNAEFDFDSDDDNVSASQSISGLLSSKGDAYSSQANFSFSPMRFRMRGYSQEYESTYINGISFNGLERGNFNYSSLGGLNYATRNKEVNRAMESTSFSFGNIGTTTNIDVRASSYAKGNNLSVSATNRNYLLRAQYTYATGLMDNGWAFTGSMVVRWANQGIVEGTSYASGGYFFSAEKKLNNRHSLSFVTFGAPTERSQQSAVTAEVTELTGSIYYNPYWGYQNGKKRNSRVVKSYDPTAILSYEWKIDEKQMLRAGLAYHYSKYSNSALTFYNSPDPRPDYYRNLPSFLNDGYFDADGNLDESLMKPEVIALRDYMADRWREGDPNYTQLDWDMFYQANYKNNTNNPNGTAKYAVERRHNDLMETAFNANYVNKINDKLRLTAGVDAKYSKGIHYKTMDDLLGANQWIDIDQFAERDLTGGTLQEMSSIIIQNNIGQDSIIHQGDKFGYDYDINITRLGAFVQNEWEFNKVEFYYAAKLSYTQFYRFGRMENGRAYVIDEISKGKGKTWFFTDPGVKAGVVWKINGRNIITANVLAETQAPLPYNSYTSVRIKDTRVKGLKSEKILSYDLAYNFSFPKIHGRIAAFQTHSLDGVKLSGYYDDEYRTFINYSMSGIDKVYRGVEAGVSIKAGKLFTVVLAGTFADYHYTSDANGVASPENGAFDDIEDIVNIKDLKVATGPQLATSLALKFFHPKMWFADITLNYFDHNYLDIAPSRFTSRAMEKYGPDVPVYDNDGNIFRYKYSPAHEALGTQERLKGGFMLDASVGKLIYLKNRNSISINLSVNNLLNSKMITGGYQQGRLPLYDGEITTNFQKFPNKYYYANGLNFFLNVGYRF